MLVNTTTMTMDSKPCPRCGSIEKLPVTAEGIALYENGSFVHQAFPHFDPDQIERLLTGYDSACWDLDFADDAPVIGPSDA